MFFFLIPLIFLRKPQIEARIKLVEARYANLDAVVKSIPDWSMKVPEVAKAVNSGIYDNDCLANKQVCKLLPLIFNFSSFYTKWFAPS